MSEQPLNAPNNHRNNQINSPEKEETFFLMSELHKTPHLTQRELSLRLNISLGKTNYLLKQLMAKGILKIRNFSTRPGKLGKVKYILTKKGIEEKLNLAYYFLKRKEEEYNHFKKECEELVLDRGKGS